MQIELSDIEPEIANRVCTNHATSKSGNTSINKNAHHKTTRRAEFTEKHAFILLCVLGFISLLICSLTTPSMSAWVVPLFILGVSWFVLSLPKMFRFFQKPEANPTLKLGETTLQAVAQNRAEKLYAELVAELIQVSPENELSARTLLAEVNTLLASFRALEEKAEACKKAMASRSVMGLEVELRDMKIKAAEATDPTTREALEQSVELCASRLESVRTLSIMRERALAQQEVILQTLGSLHALFARLRAVPSETAFEGQQLTATVSELHNRTRAVEQAIEELTTVRLGG
jgi:hypothetical protein